MIGVAAFLITWLVASLAILATLMAWVYVRDLLSARRRAADFEMRARERVRELLALTRESGPR